jgi:hypothetical protein
MFERESSWSGACCCLLLNVRDFIMLVGREMEEGVLRLVAASRRKEEDIMTVRADRCDLREGWVSYGADSFTHD